MRYYVGVDLGGTNLRAAVVDVQSGTALLKQQAATLAYEGHEAVIHRMVELIQRVVAQSGFAPAELGGVGIGVPGTPDIEQGLTLLLTNLPGQWRNVPLRAMIEEQIRLPVALINDVRAMTLGEGTFGAGRGAEHAVCFAIGTGIGGGVIVNGKLHLGLGGTAGEFGHQVVERDGLPCGCGGRGCLELYASGPAIAAMGAKEVMHGHTTRIGELCGYDINRITAETVVRAAIEGDRYATEIIQRAGTYLGIVVANVIGVVSPQRVIFGGGVAKANDLLLAPVRRVVRERVHVIPVDQIEFVQTALGLDAGLIGAALWAAQRCEDRRQNLPQEG